MPILPDSKSPSLPYESKYVSERCGRKTPPLLDSHNPKVPVQTVISTAHMYGASPGTKAKLSPGGTASHFKPTPTTQFTRSGYHD